MIRETAGPAMTFDLEEVRAEIGAVAGSHVISGLATARPGVGSVSDVVRFNRVEGLAVGGGWLYRPGGGPTSVRGLVSYGFGDRRLKGAVSLRVEAPGLVLTLEGGRRVVDVGDGPVVAPALNSLLAQEIGKDFGHYVLRDGAEITVRHPLGTRRALALSLGIERTSSLSAIAMPASDSFPANPALGVGRLGVARLRLVRRSPELTVRGGVGGRIQIEAGSGSGVSYVRVRGSGRVQVPLGGTDFLARGWVGWGSRDLPAYRSFVLGGRGTLMVDPFRAWGGRQAAFGTLEWRVRLPFVAIPLGPFISTGRQVIVAPFVSAGWAGRAVPGVPWRASDGVRPAVGVALEWFHRLFRLEWGVNREGEMGLVVDVGRDLWGIL
jgi:hypothetical protein